VKDWHQVMYFHRLHSYQRTPYKATWNSPYGNGEVQSIVTTDTLKTTPLPFTRDEWLEKYASRGLTFPTMGDYVWFADTELSADDRALFQRAQYFAFEDNPDVSTMQKLHAAQLHRLDRFRTMRNIDIDDLQDANAMRDIFNESGLKWSFMATDP